MRKLVYWGIGKVGKRCMEYFPERPPEFIIDSYCADKEYKGIPVVRPGDIADWGGIYIVMAVEDDTAIREFLEQKNLAEKEDFCGYKSFFYGRDEKAEENIARLRDAVSGNSGLANRTLIFALPFAIRQPETCTNFFRRYAGHKKCVLVHNLGQMPEKIASEKLGFPAFNAAAMSAWNICDKESCRNDTLEITDLSASEKKWIYSLGCRKNAGNDAETVYYMQQEYQYLKHIAGIFNPRDVIIWGCWSYACYMLGHICGERHIPCGYMEHGWLPGTYQFDPKGIAGQGECAKMPNPDMGFGRLEISKIKKYIVDNGLDSGSFKPNASDEEKLGQIDSGRKTVFLAGMDDSGMGMNPRDEYWKAFVSSAVSSTEEAYRCIKRICLKYNWNFIFKPHPGNSLDTDEADKFVFQDIQIDRLIEKADVVVSISSAVNYKALLHGRPLVQIGITCLSGKGCCYEAGGKGQIEENIIAAMENGMTEAQKDNFDRHLAVLLDNYLWDDLSERQIRYGLTFDRDFPFK